MKLTQLRQLIKESFQEIMNEQNIDEMARVAKKLVVDDQAKYDAFKEKHKGNWFVDILNYLEQHPDASEKEIALGIGKGSQQQVNGVTSKMRAAGILKYGDHVKPLAPKHEPEHGKIGRKKDLKKHAAIAVYKALKSNMEPSAEDLALLDQTSIDTIKAKVAQGETRGRKPGFSSQQLNKPERDVTTEPGVKVIDDREERIQKQADKLKGLEDAKSAVIKHKADMKAKAKEYASVKGTGSPEEAKVLADLKAMTKKGKELEKALDSLT